MHGAYVADVTLLRPPSPASKSPGIPLVACTAQHHRTDQKFVLQFECIIALQTQTKASPKSHQLPACRVHT